MIKMFEEEESLARLRGRRQKPILKRIFIDIAIFESTRMTPTVSGSTHLQQLDLNFLTR